MTKISPKYYWKNCYYHCQKSPNSFLNILLLSLPKISTNYFWKYCSYHDHKYQQNIFWKYCFLPKISPFFGNMVFIVTKNNTKMFFDNIAFIILQLEFTPLTELDYGTFLCWAANSIGRWWWSLYCRHQRQHHR